MSDHPPPLHVEMYDGRAFCSSAIAYSDVDQAQWHADPREVARAGCVECLRRIAELGRAAERRLRALGVP